MTTRAEIVAEARTWIGTRYRHQARVKGVATDCIGLLGGVALACGLPGAREWADDLALHAYARTPDPALLRAGVDRFLDRLPAVQRAREGDVLLFALEGEPRHFALVSEATGAGPVRVIHAYALLAARRVVEQLLPVARAQAIGAYGFRGLTA